MRIVRDCNSALQAERFCCVDACKILLSLFVHVIKCRLEVIIHVRSREHEWDEHVMQRMSERTEQLGCDMEQDV